MNKRFKNYLLTWGAFFCLFNFLAFIIPAWPTIEKFSASFWIAWTSTTATFVGQLVCAWFALKDTSAKMTFYRMSLFSVSYTGLIIMFAVAIICILITPLPCWITAVACVIVLAFNIFAVADALRTVDVVSTIDEKIESATAFIYDMRANSESLSLRAKNDAARCACKKVTDAFKYSDPMSAAALASIESEIETHFTLFQKAVADDIPDAILAESNELLALIADRNNKCKILK